MGRVLLYGSIIVVRSNRSASIGVDSLTTNDWGQVLSHDYTKAFPLGDDENAILAFSGPASFFKHLQEKCNEKFSSSPKMTISEKVLAVKEIAEAYMVGTLLAGVEDETLKKEIIADNDPDIVIVGHDKFEDEIVMFTIPWGQGFRVEGQKDEVLFGGTGADPLKNYFETLPEAKRVSQHDMTVEDAIEKAKGALEHATKKDLSTGGVLRVHTVNSSGISTRTWDPIDLKRAAAGYGEPLNFEGFRG